MAARDITNVAASSSEFILSEKVLRNWTVPYKMLKFLSNRPFSYSAKEPGSSVIFIHF